MLKTHFTGLLQFFWKDALYLINLSAFCFCIFHHHFIILWWAWSPELAPGKVCWIRFWCLPPGVFPWALHGSQCGVQAYCEPSNDLFSFPLRWTTFACIRKQNLHSRPEKQPTALERAPTGLDVKPWPLLMGFYCHEASLRHLFIRRVFII